MDKSFDYDFTGMVAVSRSPLYSTGVLLKYSNEFCYEVGLDR